MSKPPSSTPWLALLAVAAYGLRFGVSWLLLQRVPPARFDPEGFGLLGDAIELALLAIPLGALLWWVLHRRGPWRGLFAPAASPGRTMLSVLLLLLIGAPTLGQGWTMILLPLTESWPVLLSALLWFAVVALLRALAVTCVPADLAELGSERWAGTIATGVLLAAVALPFVLLFPEPPAFGHGAGVIVAAFAVLATIGTTFRASGARRARIMRRAAILLAITAATIGLRILLSGDMILSIPTPDLLPRLFGLQGEEIDDAFYYEVWLELWLVCALPVLLVAWSRRPARPAAGRMDPPWNPGTILIVLIGWAALAGAVFDGHRTADFLAQATRVTGEIADDEPHPHIRFTTAEGMPVIFRQNGFVSRPAGAAIPVAYWADDPAGTAQADTFWVDWGEILGLIWIGLGFSLHPFFGFRATLQAGRW